MQFCEECGTMMVAAGSEMVCRNEQCGHVAERDEDRAAAFVSTEAQDDSELVETEEGSGFEPLPTAAVTCARCDHDRAWYTIKQTASADEPPTRFFKCTDCGYRWRDYN